MMHGETQIKIF